MFIKKARQLCALSSRLHTPVQTGLQQQVHITFKLRTLLTSAAQDKLLNSDGLGGGALMLVGAID